MYSVDKLGILIKNVEKWHLQFLTEMKQVSSFQLLMAQTNSLNKHIIRPFIIGKNQLFPVSIKGVDARATTLNLEKITKANNHDPYNYYRIFIRNNL